jgi:Domain of unknown function (DUF4328)
MSDFPSPPPPPPPPPPNMGPPPGYVAYGGPGAAMSGSFSKVGGICKALVVLLIIFIPLQLLGVIGLIQLSGKAQDFLDGTISENEFTDATSTNLSSLSGLLIIPIAVLTMIIMFRMAKNLRVLGRSGATWAAGWAIGGWFCPPCAIYAIPWLMFRELWRGSDAEVPPNDPSWKTRPVSPLVNIWWVLYGLVPLIGLATSASFVSNLGDFDAREVAQNFDDFLMINIVLALVGAATAGVYLVMIRQLTARHMAATREA